jgi:hypothetical protein
MKQVARYYHAFSDRRRVLDWQLDLLQSYTQLQYNSLDTKSLQLLSNFSLSNNNQQLPNNSPTALTTLLTTENSEVYDLWSDCRGDSAFGIGCLAIT